MTIAPESILSSYRSIFLHQNDTPSDREIWRAASCQERLEASDKVHANTSSTNRYRVAWGLPT